MCHWPFRPIRAAVMMRLPSLEHAGQGKLQCRDPRVDSAHFVAECVDSLDRYTGLAKCLIGDESGPASHRGRNGCHLAHRKLFQGFLIATTLGLQLAVFVAQEIGAHGGCPGRVVEQGELELAPLLLGVEAHQLDSKIVTECGRLRLGPGQRPQHDLNAVR